MLHQEAHDAGLGEAGGQPERRRADQLGGEIEVVATSGASGVQVRSGAFGSAPCARSALTIFSSRRMIAACSAVKPAAAAFGSAPLLEQELDQVAEAGVRGQRRGADAPGIGIVHVGAGGHEQLRRRRDRRRARQTSARCRRRAGSSRLYSGIAVRRHGHHLAPDLRAGVDVGAVREQHLDDVGMLLRRPPTSAPSGRARRARSRWRLSRAAVRRRRDCRSGRRPSRGVSPSRSASVRIRAGLQQPADHRRAAVQAGGPERRGAEIVRRVHLGAGANQQVGALDIVAVARPVQRGRAVRLGGVDVRRPA